MVSNDLSKLIDNLEGLPQSIKLLARKVPAYLDKAEKLYGVRDPEVEFVIKFMEHNEIYTDFAKTPVEIRIGPISSLEKEPAQAQFQLLQELMQIIAPPRPISPGAGLEWTNLDKGVSTTFTESNCPGLVFPPGAYLKANQLFKKLVKFAGKDIVMRIRAEKARNGLSLSFADITYEDIKHMCPMVPDAIAFDLEAPWERNVGNFRLYDSWKDL